MNSLAIYDAVNSSNLSPSKKTGVMQFLERQLGRNKWSTTDRVLREYGMSRPKPVQDTVMGTFRCTTESVGTGAALGAIHASLPNGLDLGGKFPLDVIGAVIGLGIRAGYGSESLGDDAGTVGGSCATVFGFRKMYDLIAAKRIKAGTLKAASTVAGDDMGEDPIIAAARAL